VLVVGEQKTQKKQTEGLRKDLRGSTGTIKATTKSAARAGDLVGGTTVGGEGDELKVPKVADGRRHVTKQVVVVEGEVL